MKLTANLTPLTVKISADRLFCQNQIDYECWDCLSVCRSCPVTLWRFLPPFPERMSFIWNYWLFERKLIFSSCICCLVFLSLNPDSRWRRCFFKVFVGELASANCTELCTNLTNRNPFVWVNVASLATTLILSNLRFHRKKSEGLQQGLQNAPHTSIAYTQNISLCASSLIKGYTNFSQST